MAMIAGILSDLSKKKKLAKFLGNLFIYFA